MLFLQQSPHVDLAPTIGIILEQATTLAENRGILLLAFGQLMVVLKYFVSNPQLFDNTGDIIRLVGLATLLAAVLRR